MDPVEKIKSLTPEHFSEICRICLTSEALRLIPETLVGNIEAIDLFEDTIGVQFDKNDLMPHNICDKCLATLSEMYKLKKQCLINELLFKTQIDYYKILPKEELNTEEEIEDDIVKREIEVEEDLQMSPLNGDIVNTVTTTSEEIEKLNDIKVEPDDYDLPLEEEKGNKPEEGPEIDITDRIIETVKTEQPMITSATEAPTSSNIPLEPKKKQDNTKIPCAICKKFIGWRSMASHMFQMHESQNSIYQCDQCPRTFKVKGNLKLHYMRHTGIYPHNCPNCKKGFASPSTLKSHKTNCKRDKEEFVCKYCEQNFISRFSFRSHLRLHLERNEIDQQEISEYFKDCPFSCESCLTSYETEESLKQHIRNKHRGASFLCNMCGKNLTTQRGLDNHIRTHTGERPFSCKVCQQTFINSGKLKRHMFKHTEERPFQCNICSKRFKIVKQLNNHLLVHKGDKPYQCSFCDKKFAVNGNLRKHISIHTGEKRHYCSICNKGYYDKNMMRKHEAKHESKAKKEGKTKTKNVD